MNRTAVTKFDHLSACVVELSVADAWDEAKLEWEFEKAVLSEEPEKCLCTHHPIKELCYIKNRRNANRTMVGNCCVRHFFGIHEPTTIFQALKRVEADATRSLGKVALKYAVSQHIFNAWEIGFYSNTVSKRRLSHKQQAKREALNNKFVNRLRQSRKLR